MLSQKDRTFLERLNEKVVSLGYEDFDLFYSSRLSSSLREIAKELGVSYNSFSSFCSRYYEHKKATCPSFTLSDFKGFFHGCNDEECKEDDNGH